MNATPHVDAGDDRSTQLDRVLVSAFMESIPDFVCFKDRRCRYIAASKSYVRYLNRSMQAQIIGHTDFDFFAAPHARQMYQEEQAVMHTGQPILGQSVKAVWPDGRVDWLLSSRLPLRDEQGAIIGTLGISRDVTRTKQMELELEQAHKAIVEASRNAGMAEVATGILHNVGNVLNNLTVSAGILAQGLRQSKAGSLLKLAHLVNERRHDLGAFLASDPKGRKVPEFLVALAQHAADDRKRLLTEIESLQKSVDHVKDIVSMQQRYATMIGVIEALDPATLLDDALRMTADSLARDEVRVERVFQPMPPTLGERAKILQILVNFIRNAKFACEEGTAGEKKIVLRLEPAPEGHVRFAVQDNGVGIRPENLTRIFQHGFTTRTHGHGFGLHSAANAAREMKGRLLVESDGPGRGATFSLELPLAPLR